MDEAKNKLVQAVSSSLSSAGVDSNAAIQPLAAVSGTALELASDAAKQAAKNIAQYASDHPVIATAVVASAVLTVAPQVLAVPALQMVGFGAEGVIANSAAAAAQSGIGNVAAGSVFSTLQSAAAGGAGAAVVNGIVQSTGAAAGVAAVGGRFLLATAAGLKAKL